MCIRAASTCKHVAADKIQRFPCILEYFVDVNVVRSSVALAVIEFGSEKNGVRFFTSAPIRDAIQAKNFLW